MKQWGVQGYRVCVFWVECKNVLVLRQFVKGIVYDENEMVVNFKPGD